MPVGDGEGSAEPEPAVRAALGPLLSDPATTAILTDFDGTLSPIVADPYLARPLDGTGEVLVALAERFGEVAVVSGRPVSYLVEHLPVPRSGGRGNGVHLVGLYGLEQVREGGPEGGTIEVEPAARRWVQVVADTVPRLEQDAPDGVLVEPKGLAVTVHWRRAPTAEPWVRDTVAAEAARSGLRAHPGRMSLELRPPLDVDKGSVVRTLAGSCSAACYFGDDLGDLPAFAELAALRLDHAVRTVSVAVVDAESDPRVAEAADLTLDGQRAALDALSWLAAASARR